MSKKNNMTRKAVLFLPAKILEGVLLLMMSSQYTHIFTEEAAGTFGYVQQTINFSYLLVAAWIANSCTRYVAEEYKKDEARSMLSTISVVYIFLCIFGVLSCFILASVFKNTTYIAGAIMFCSYTAFTILINALVQLDKVKQAIIFSLLSAVLKLLIAVLLVRGKSNFADPTPAFVANITADGLGALGALFALSMPKLVRFRFVSKEILSKMFVYGVPLIGVALCSGLLTLFDRFYIYGVFGNATGGIYYYNSSVPNSVFTMLSVGILRGVYPAVLREWSEGGKEEAKNLLGSGVRLYMLVAFPAAFGLAAVSRNFCSVFFSSGYEIGYSIIATTAFAMVFMGLTEYANKGYELEQNTKPVIVNCMFAMIIKIVASILCVNIFGFTGGAWGSLIAFASYFLITSIRVRKYFMWRVPFVSFVKILVAAFLCGICAYMCTLININEVLRLFVAVFVGGFVYVVFLVFSGEAKDEVNMIISRLRR